MKHPSNLWTTISWTSLSLFLAACSAFDKNITNKQSEQLKLHQIYINKDGMLLDPITKLVIKDEHTYVNRILENLHQSEAHNLTIYIHGGLNTFENSTSRVRDINPAKVLAEEGKYLLFISWHSGPLTNYADHLFYLRRGRKATTLGPLSSPFVLMEDAFRSIARIPASTYNLVIGQNSIIKKVRSKDALSAERALPLLQRDGFAIHNSPVDSGMSFSDWWSVVNPVKLFTAPFVDGLGTGAWDSMLRRADLVLRKDIVFDSPVDVDTSTAVTKFLNKYAVRHKSNSTTIIAHSMGAVIANNIISNYPRIGFDNIVYIAAACRLKDIEYVVVPYIGKNTSAQFYNLSLHTYRDIAENTYYDFVPRGSLLLWIDDIFGNTNSFKDRTAGYWLNMVRGAEVTFGGLATKERIHLTQFALAGDVPLAHGDFSHFKFWKDEFWLGQAERLN